MDVVPVTCAFEEVEAGDLLDALTSFSSRDPLSRSIAMIGSGTKSQIDWAVADVGAATEADDPRRHLVNAVMNARRALACWVDSYIECFGFALCKSRPRNSVESTDLLVRRGLIDHLSARVIRRVIEQRNDIEHAYLEVSQENAEDAVELMRLTLKSLNYHTPFHGVDERIAAPWLFGSYGYQARSNATGTRVDFKWYSVSFVLGVFFDPPWLGIVEPLGEKEVSVRKCLYRSTPLRIYEEILSILEVHTESSHHGMDTNSALAFAKAAGLI